MTDHAPPTRDDLLDIEWLTRTQDREGLHKVIQYVRAGAERYGGPVTAIAEALINERVFRLYRVIRNDIDLRAGLPHLLLNGSWTVDPGGPRAHPRGPGCFYWFFSPAKRAELYEKYKHPPCEPGLPDLRALRLLEPFDCVWAAHTDGIWGCEVSRDGKHMVSASRDGDVAVWDMERGTLVARAKTGEPDVRDCGITPDGTRVLSMHKTGPLCIWNLQTMTLVARLQTPGDTGYRVRRFAVSDDGGLVAVAGSDGVDVCDLQTLQRLARLPTVDPDHHPIALAFDSNERVICAHHGASLGIVTWDWRSHTAIESHGLLGPPMDRRVNRAIITPDRRHFIAATGHETTVWQIGKAIPLSQVPYGTSGEALALSSDGCLAATCDDGTPDKWQPVVRVWSLPDLRELWRLNLTDVGCRDIACALAFTPDAQRLVIAGWEGAIRRAVLPAHVG